MRIAVASGKGGTGKTMMATNLARVLACDKGMRVAYVDADVEEPNGHLFLKPEISELRRLALPVPSARGDGCTACGACVQACEFNALALVEGEVRLEARACRSCGLCLIACPERVITEVPRELGTVSQGQAGPVEFWSGLLDMGEPRAAPLIREMLRWVREANRGRGVLELIDVSPGTSCSALVATRVADLVILVTEPTPFGRHDLELAVEMCHAAGQPMGIIINRSDLGDSREMRAYIKDRELKLLAEIPFIKEAAQAYARQQLAADQVPSFRRRIAKLVRKLRLG